MRITKISCGYVLDTGIQVTVFHKATMQEGSTPDINIITSGVTTSWIPNLYIKEFKDAFKKVGGQLI